MGARKLAVINSGLIGCVPAARAFQPLGACAEDVNLLAAGFNAALRSPLLPRYVQGTPYPCRIRIRYGYAMDTPPIRIQGVSEKK